MSAYTKLPSDNQKTTKNSIEELSASVKLYEQRLKELRKLFAEFSVKKTKEFSGLIQKKQEELINQTNSIRNLLKTQPATNEKQKYDMLKKTAEVLFKQFTDLEQPSVKIEEETDIGPEFVHRESISIENMEDLQNDLLQNILEDIQNLQKDFYEVNNLFKEVSTMISEQGDLLNESEKHVDVAVTETGRANVELESANNYQRSAKKKAVCILITVIVIVLVLVAIIIVTTA